MNAVTVAGLFLCLMVTAAELRPTAEELCGTYSLYVGLNSLDAELSGLDALERTLGPPPRGGHSMAELARTAEKLGFKTLGVQTNLRHLSQRTGRFACIAHMKHGHFVLIAKVDESGVHVVDPPRRNVVAEHVWNAAWGGPALLISRDPLLPEQEVEVLSQLASQAELTRQVRQQWGSILAVVLSVVVGVGLVVRWRRAT